MGSGISFPETTVVSLTKVKIEKKWMIRSTEDFLAEWNYYVWYYNGIYMLL